MEDKEKYVATNRPPENFNLENNSNSNKFNYKDDKVSISGEIKIDVDLKSDNTEFVPEKISKTSLNNRKSYNDDYYNSALDNADSISRLQQNSINSMDSYRENDMVDNYTNQYGNNENNNNVEKYNNKPEDINQKNNNDNDNQNIDENSNNNDDNRNADDNSNSNDDQEGNSNSDNKNVDNQKKDNMVNRSKDLKREGKELNDPNKIKDLKNNKNDAKNAKKEAKQAKNEAKQNKKDNPEAYKDAKNKYKGAKDKYKDAKKDVRSNRIDRLKNAANRVQNAKNMLDDPEQAMKDWANSKFNPKEMAQNYARKVGNDIKNKAANKAKDVGRKAKDKVKDVSKQAASKVKGALKEFFKKHPTALITVIVFILILFLILLLMMVISGSAAAIEEEEQSSVGSYAYYEPNFSQVTVTWTDSSGNILEDNIPIKNFLSGMAYGALGDACEQEYQAYMVVAKAYLLNKVQYVNTNLSITVQNDDPLIPYCNVDSGCSYSGGDDSKTYYPKDYDPTYTNVDVPSADIANKIYSAYDSTTYYILAPSGISSFTSISYDVPFSDYIIKAIKVKCDDEYNDIIKRIKEFDGYEVINAEATFKKYSSVSCSSGDWLWPSGSAECTEENGVKICVGTPQVTTTSATFPKYKSGGDHKGIDISDNTARGTNVIASRAGTVIVATDGYGDGYIGNKDGDGFGNHVIIDHGDGYFTIYGHLLKGSVSSNVKVGDIVVAGQLIGQIGTSGNSSGNHLHFQINLGSKYEVAQDPLNFVSPESTRTASCSGGSWDIFKSEISEEEFISKMEAYCGNKNNNFCINFASKAESVFETSEKYNVNPELVVVTAGTEQSWNSHGTNNYWGINVPNGAGISTKYSSLEEGIENYAKYINLYQDQSKWYYGSIVDTNTIREKAGCKAQGHGMPNTLEGMQSLWSSVGTYRFNPGSWGLGGCKYLNIIYGSTYCDTVPTCPGSSNCPSNSKTTTCEQNDYTAYQVQEKLDLRMKIFGY